MKNARIEALYRKYRKTKLAPWRKDATGFCEIYHCYDDPRELSYWDDTAFMAGNKRVVVTWIHPRLKYSDRCEEIAWECLPDKAEPSLSWLDDADPQYKKVGKSRKKITSWLCRELDQATKDRHGCYTSMREMLLRTNQATIVTPHLRFEYWRQALNMNVCFPFEVRSEADVLALAKLCKEIYYNRELFNEKFGGFEYTCTDWCREHPEKEKEISALAGETTAT